MASNTVIVTDAALPQLTKGTKMSGIVTIDSTFDSLIRECLGKFDLTPEKNFNVFRVVWSDRYQTKFGTALYLSSHNSALIQISRKLWDRATEFEKKEVLWHEVCHVVDHYFLNTKGRALWPSSVGHGEYWQALMLKVGLVPKRCHKVPVGDVTVSCLNGKCSNFGKKLSITKHRATRWKNQGRVKCPRCLQLLSFATITDSER